MSILDKRKIFTAFHPYPYSGYSEYVWVEGKINTLYPSMLVDLPLKDLKVYKSHGAKAAVVFYNKSTKQTTLGYRAADAANGAHAYKLTMYGWDSRLYAGAYAKFTDAARQGSAEWGMNIVQARKALKTFIQLSLTSATTIAAFVQAHRVGIAWLRNKPHASLRKVIAQREATDRRLRLARTASERRRLSNLLWTLDTVSGTLLAYRYGVAPLLKDLYTTAQEISEPFMDNVSLRKSSNRAIYWPGTAEYGPATGKESVVLKATVSVSNPNALLANRLGLINPQLWVWDAIPWSFVVDWWFPLGTFLGNLTALVGLKLEDASVTRSLSFNAEYTPDKTFDAYRKSYPHITVTVTGGGQVSGKRKVRTTGSLPVPLSVPYGTGLGIQRGQNALALCAQLLKGKLNK